MMEEAPRSIDDAWKSGARELDLDGRELNTLPEVIGRLSRLQKLDLTGNRLSTLPEAIGRLSRLQELYLSGNQLNTLPEAVGRLSGLQLLDLSRNQLGTLPEGIGRLSQLRWLYLSRNQLSMVPEAIERLSQLEELDLSGNQLSTLPEAMRSLERLNRLFLHSNPGLGLPDEVLGPMIEELFVSQDRPPKPPREILDYYFATRGAQGRSLREVRLIVVGRGGAGKTSLIKRLKGEPFHPHERDARHQHPRAGAGLRGWAGTGAGVGLWRAACTPCYARVFPHCAQPLLAGAWRAGRHGRARRRLLALCYIFGTGGGTANVSLWEIFGVIFRA
jgi:Leucine rich repeat